MGASLKDFPAVLSASSAPEDAVRGYRPELDALRFLAFCLIFVNHDSPRVHLQEPFFIGGVNGWRVELTLTEMPSMGLCLFFALSAYLITGLLLKERQITSTISVRNFYIRRTLRIWPLYFVGVAIGVVIGILIHSTRDKLAVLFFLFFSGNFYVPLFGLLPNPMYPLWSISIEEQFYLVWPWAIRFLSKRGMLISALLFIVVANAMLFHYGQLHVETASIVWPNTLVQFEMFAVGILLALRESTPRKPHFLGGLALALCAPPLWFIACYWFHVKQPIEAGAAIGGISLMVGYALIAIGCAALLHGFCLFDPSRIPRWASGLGKISYGLYVFHNLAIEFSKAVFQSAGGFAKPAGTAVLAFILTLSAASISYVYLETPFLRLKRRFEVLHSRPI